MNLKKTLFCLHIKEKKCSRLLFLIYFLKVLKMLFKSGGV